MDEWFVYQASQFLGCSYMELDAHPRKHSLMATAFTLQSGVEDGKALVRAKQEQRAKLGG